VPSHNGFEWQCPRNEGELASTNPFTNGPGFVFPIGLFNRLDLAPVDGSNCGEYRIVFGNTTSRNLVIFEAVLPNPNPSCGLQACRPVAELWSSLSSPTTTASQARSALEQLYFTGLPGFEPVVHWSHYGAVGGQVRSNQFMSGSSQQLWNLKEFNVARLCSGAACRLEVVPVTVKTNPATQLFSDTTTDSRKAAFQSAFIDQVQSLAVNDINAFGMSVVDGFNSGQSHSQSFDSGLRSPTITNDYGQVFNPTGPFGTAIQQRLTQIGSTLTPREIVDRATTQSCGGCHSFSGFRPIGGGITWPPAAGFVHVSEFGQEQAGFGPGFPISDALKNVFLPHRRNVMQSFLAQPPLQCSSVVAAKKAGMMQAAAAPPPSTTTKMTLGGKRSTH